MINTDEKIQVVYSDADTLSSFLNRNSFEYFMKVFEGLDIEVVLPQKVKDELCRGRYAAIRKSAIDQMVRTNRIKLYDFQADDAEAKTYHELSKHMGQGEAAALALAKNSKRPCVVASNNFSDVIKYAEENDIELWPTTTIMTKAVDMGFMSMETANTLWKNMKKDGLRLPSYEKFEDYYNQINS